MTVKWSTYAQSLTKRPMKGMLTGPVTDLQWSFVRDDQPRGETCRQIALALRDEVTDLEAAGIAMIQVDEPAIREGSAASPSRLGDYLRWAVDAFLLTTSGRQRRDADSYAHVLRRVRRHPRRDRAHGCRRALDRDLAFEDGAASATLPSSAIPTRWAPASTISTHRAWRRATRWSICSSARCAVIPAARLWVNPDCGLKTRAWPEVEKALANMVAAAEIARTRFK